MGPIYDRGHDGHFGQLEASIIVTLRPIRGQTCIIVSVFLVVGVYLVSISPGDVGRPEPGAHILHTLTR